MAAAPRSFFLPVIWMLVHLDGGVLVLKVLVHDHKVNYLCFLNFFQFFFWCFKGITDLCALSSACTDR